MRAKLVFGCLGVFGLAVAAQAGPPGEFAREDALAVYPSPLSILRTAATNASSVDPGLDTRIPFTRGRTRPMFSEPDSLVRPRGVAGPKIFEPAVSTSVTVAR